MTLSWSAEFKWDAASIAKLRELHPTNFSYSEIGKLMGGISRNAVIGKAHRLGLRREKKQPKPPRKSRANPEPSITLKRLRMGPHGHMVMAPEVVTQAGPDPVANPLHVQIVELEGFHCRWPYTHDGRPTTYCGHGKVGGSSYCENHQQAAFTPVGLRRSPFVPRRAPR